MVPGFEAFPGRQRGDTSAAAGSAHHHPSHVFRPTPARVAAEANAQNAVSAESAIRARVAERVPVRRLATARPGMTIRAAPATAKPAALTARAGRG